MQIHLYGDMNNWRVALLTGILVYRMFNQQETAGDYVKKEAGSCSSADGYLLTVKSLRILYNLLCELN